MFDEEDSDFQCFLNSFLPNEYDYSVINFESIKSYKLRDALKKKSVELKTLSQVGSSHPPF